MTLPENFTPPRYASNRPLPPYAYVPGKFPHPTSDPAGHMFGQEEDAAQPITRADWPASGPYLFAIDLFNHGYYWEAHESWELLWQAAGRRGLAADFLKALIKLAAAGVKAREGRPEGIRRHALRADELLLATHAELPAGTTHFLGLSLHELRELAQQLAASPNAVVNTCDDAAVVVMPATLKLDVSNEKRV